MSENQNNYKEYKDFIEDLSKIINTSTIAEINFKKDDIEVSIKKHSNNNINESFNFHQITPPHYTPSPSPSTQSIPQNTPINSNQNSPIQESNSAFQTISSPMVGVVYLSSSPEAEPFIKIGSQVNEGDTLLLIEAMKVFNNVKSPKKGIIKQILVTSNQTVEYNEPLIVID